MAEAMDKQLKIGDGMDKESNQGPLINQMAVEKVRANQTMIMYGIVRYLDLSKFLCNL